MKKVFIWLWTVVALFVLGVVLVLTASFTTTSTDFAGQADLYLKFESSETHRPLEVSVFDLDGNALKPESTGYVLLHPKFESRETNVFDTLAENGPLPRTAVVAFTDGDRKRHEIAFNYDRHGRVWQAVVSFPDPSIADVQVVNSSLDFKGMTGPRRHFESTIYAKALIGPPIVNND